MKNRPGNIFAALLLSPVIAILLLVLIDKLTPQIKDINSPSIEKYRYIRLREHFPFSGGDNNPAASDADALAKNPRRCMADENGFIKPSNIHAEPDIKIVFLGGSTTECILVEERNRFPYLSGRILEKQTGKTINSYNGGVGSNNSLHSLDTLLNKVIPLDPDIVVMMHNVNDLTALALYNTYWNNNPDLSPIVIHDDKITLSPLKAIGNLAAALFPNITAKIAYRAQKKIKPADTFANVRKHKIKIDKKRLASQFKLNLKTFIYICKARQIVPVLMTQASRIKEPPEPEFASQTAILKNDYGISNKDFKDAFDLFNETIRETGIESGVKVIDLAAAVPQDKKYIYDLVHFNDEGSKKVSEIISSRLRPIVETTNKDSSVH